jgi:oligopeptide/dipeptide ABC transporter ATP-binding protein
MNETPTRSESGPTDHDLDEVDTGGSDRLLSVRGLRVSYRTATGPVEVIRDVSFTVGASETVALVGESGSGKSTIGLALMGLLRGTAGEVTGGEIRYDGQDLRSADESVMRKLRGAKLSMIFQDPLSSLNPVLTIGRQIRELFTTHRRSSRADAKRATIELLRRVRMPDPESRYRQYPQQFSGGMRQRVVIAMALALEPGLIIADEPTTALDVTVSDRILDLLADLTGEQGSGLLLITHDLAVVADRADRVYVLYAGRVLESGSIREVYERPANPYTQGLLQSVPTMDQVGHQLAPIPGSPPDPAALPTGCPFQTRCPYAKQRCTESEPELREVLPGRFSACHFAEEVIG